jgi:hypothetical protein
MIPELVDDFEDGSFGVGGVYFTVYHHPAQTPGSNGLIDIFCDHTRKSNRQFSVRNSVERMCTHFVRYLYDTKFDWDLSGAVFYDLTQNEAPILTLPSKPGQKAAFHPAPVQAATSDSE